MENFSNCYKEEIEKLVEEYKKGLSERELRELEERERLGAYRERYREVILERGMKEKEEGRGLLNE
jgi:hypothetical protein